MEFIFHIGISKTGTTSIQKFLYKSKLTKYGILYPKTGILGYAHHFIPRLKYQEDLILLEKSLIKEVNNKIYKKVIISSEELMWHYKSKQIEKIIHSIEKQNRIKFIIYLRRQDKWLESIYSQLIKMNKLKNWQEFLQEDPHLLIAYYTDFIKKWQETFPEAKIIPRIYDRKKFPEGNVILDFLSALNLNIPEAKEFKVEVNPSLSHQSTLALRKINAEYELPNEYHSKIVNYLIELDKKEGSKIKTFMTLEERKELLEEYRESNEKLFKEWFNTENQFVLTEEEIEFYKEQDKIPEEEKERAIEERYEKITEYIKTNIPDYDKYRYGIKTIPNLTIKSKEIPSIRGHVDKIDKSITGWAIDIEKKQPLTLILKINNKPIKETKTEIKRAGITKTIGEEIPVGFEISWKEIELPEELKNLPEETKCTIRVVEKEKGIVLPGNYREITIGEIKKQKEEKNPYIKYHWENIKKYFEHFHIDQFYIDIIKGGKATVGGLACLKKEIEKNYKLKIRDEEGIKEIKWGINSPVYGEKNPDNPHAKRARFLGKDIKLGKINEILLVDNLNNEYNLLKILK